MEIDNNLIMQRACDLASQSVLKGGGPFGAIITDKNLNIISEGHNMVTINNDPTQHAEIVAIRNACSKLNTFRLDNCILYTSCEPCPMCLGAIYWSKINKIYYCNTRTEAKNIGFDDEFIYEEIKKPIDERDVPLHQINIDDNLKIFNLWLEKSDKICY